MGSDRKRNTRNMFLKHTVVNALPNDYSLLLFHFCFVLATRAALYLYTKNLKIWNDIKTYVECIEKCLFCKY